MLITLCVHSLSEFIQTHTVQMKRNFDFPLPLLSGSLLNPHGSDETLLDKIRFIELEFLLNPHGSDETPYSHKASKK